MDLFKSFFAKDSVKAAIAILAFAVPLIAPLLPPAYGAPFLAQWNAYILPALVSLGLVSGGTSNLRSDQSRANLVPVAFKPPTGYLRLSLLIILALGAAILVSAPVKAKASPLTKCLAGCEEPVHTFGAKLGEVAPTAVAPKVWISPSLGLSGYTRYGNGVWQAGAAPGAGYGIRWAPSSAVTLGLDLYSQVTIVSAPSTPRRLDVDLLPVVSGTATSLGFGLSFGLGYRWLLPMESGDKGESGRLFMLALILPLPV